MRDVREDGTKRCRNPVIKTVVAAGLGRGAYAGSANESKPDGGRPPSDNLRVSPARGGNPKDKGGTRQTQVVPGRTGIQRGLTRGSLSVQGSGERSLYPAHVFPLRRAEEATASARRTIERWRGQIFHTMLPGGPTVWRRRRCWTKSTCRTRSKRRGDASTIDPLSLDGRRARVRVKGVRPLQLNAPKTVPKPAGTYTDWQLHASSPFRKATRTSALRNHLTQNVGQKSPMLVILSLNRGIHAA